MHSEQDWRRDAGMYTIPDDFYRRFLSEFPEYRIRWSRKKENWQVEQKCHNGFLPPLRVDPFDDTLIRARDGYWPVMEFQPGTRMACPAIVDFSTKQRCESTLTVPTRRGAEVICPTCRKAGRDGRTMASFWPFDECLIEHLRFSDPLRGGIKRASAAAEAFNLKMQRDAEKRAADAVQSEAMDLHRHVVGIPQFSYNHKAHPRSDGMITMKVDN